MSCLTALDSRIKLPTCSTMLIIRTCPVLGHGRSRGNRRTLVSQLSIENPHPLLTIAVRLMQAFPFPLTPEPELESPCSNPAHDLWRTPGTKTREDTRRKSGQQEFRCNINERYAQDTWLARNIQRHPTGRRLGKLAHSESCVAMNRQAPHAMQPTFSVGWKRDDIERRTVL